MKLKSIAFAAAALCAGQAHALTPAVMNDAGTLKVYVSGASALSGAIGGLFTQNCQPATRDDYTLTGNLTFGRIYTCTLNAVNDFGLGAVNVMFQKRDAGGSGQGVGPLANNTPIAFIEPTSCTIVPGPPAVKECASQSNRIPDGGVSDLEPNIFKAAVNGNFVLGGGATSVPINQTVFGLAVTQALYTALQADQGTAGQPTVPQAVVGQMLRSGFPADPVAWSLLLPNTNNGTEDSQVTICRRVNGSGTQAAANRFFLEYPANSMLPSVAGDSTAPGHGTTPFTLLVVANSAAADVVNCMTAAQTAGGFAMGHLSLENPETASYRYVKIGGQTPSRDEAKAGRYPYFFESTGQTRTGAAANVKSFLTSFFAGAGKPDNLAQLSAPVQQGVMANPNVCPDPFGGGTANEITFCSRVTRNGNSLEFPSFFR